MLEDFTMPKGTHSKGYTRTLATRKGRGSLPSPEGDSPTEDAPPPQSYYTHTCLHTYIQYRGQPDTEERGGYLGAELSLRGLTRRARLVR